MAKRKSKSKRSLSALPKGIPQRVVGGTNPFEVAKRQRRAKHEVLNHFTELKHAKTKQSKLALSLQRRQEQLRASLKRSKRANTFVDKRIGENTMTQDQQMVARLVKERSRRSRKFTKFQLDDNEEGFNQSILTHKGRALDELDTKDHVILSSDEEDGGDLNAIDTELHFGGIRSSQSSSNIYGPSTGEKNNMAQLYSKRKTELDDLIAMRKTMKAEKLRAKEKQVEAFESMDESFKELSQFLQFRDKEKEYQARLEAKRNGAPTQEDQEMADWDKEMKGYLFERRVKATDRTKTPEEIAKEEADRLHELETRRLARMNGDFENDDLSDVSDDGDRNKSKVRKRMRISGPANPDAIDDSDDEDNNDELKAKFTADGLIFTDNEGNVVKRSRDESAEAPRNNENLQGVDVDVDVDVNQEPSVLRVGAPVMGNYRVDDQFEDEESWYAGKISAVHKAKNGEIKYDVEYDDGDFEEGMDPQNVRPVLRSKNEVEAKALLESEALALRRRRQKAKNKARSEIPFVLEVPTTLEALHEMIAQYASTGNDVSLILQRIHAANSVRLDKRNKEKMQNFYDVLLRRFIAVGDATHASGNGGKELDRHGQLDSLTKTLYRMSQDSPECAGAIWGRRLGILQKAHAKRLRDVGLTPQELEGNEEDRSSFWPSPGTLLLLKALGHIFPVTDRRHVVVTPATLLLGQILVQTPVYSVHDIVCGVFCCGIMLDFTKHAKRITPEVFAFLSGVLQLYVPCTTKCTLPSLHGKECQISSLRRPACQFSGDSVPQLALEKAFLEASDSAAAALLFAALHMVEAGVRALTGYVSGSEPEVFAELTESLLAIKPCGPKDPFPKMLNTKVTAVASALRIFQSSQRKPLKRRSALSKGQTTIKSLAPRMEDPSRYNMSRDKKKSAVQAAVDRTRREYKREHKAVSRELRMDASFIEKERRQEKEKKDNKARAKRQKNFAWLEGEQAAMNQQVRQGGGLLAGGGMGAARAKAKSGIGIKKGGKF